MLAFWLSLAIVILDQVTKSWIVSRFTLGESLPFIPGYFSLVYVRNTGAAWGLFGDFTGFLIVLSVAVLVVLIVFRRVLMGDGLIHRVALGLMIGGIVGNLFDRVRLGYVVDFLDFYWKNHHFPAFNVADSAICVGVGLLMLSSLLPSSGKPVT